MAAPPPSTAGITPSEKAQLHNVADLVLQIYLTLARMRHVDPDHIQRGPHDLSHLYPLFAALGLDPRVVYLYHILPYLDLRRAVHVGFVQGTRPADFRREEDVRCARELFANDSDPGNVLRPWMTALGGFGERGQVMMYDAQRDVVHLLGDFSEGSWDWNLEEGQGFEKWSEERGEMVWYEKPVDGREDVPLVEVVDIEAWRRARGWYGDEDGEEEEEQNGEGEQEGEGGEEEQNGEEGQGDEMDEDDNEDNDDDSESEQEIYWNEMEARPAIRVLQDVIRWYHEIVELPGDCVACIGWSAAVVRPLYRRHGWPGEDFDGDAFVVDRVRSRTPDYLFWGVGRVQDKMGLRVRQYEIGAAQRQENFAAAKTIGEEWAARWDIWIAEKDTAWWKDRARMAREWEVWAKAREDADGPPLRELVELQWDLGAGESQLNTLTQSLEAANNPSSRQLIQLQILDAEKTLAIVRQACEATRADVERVGPGKPLYSLYTTDIVVKMEYLMRTLHGWEREVAEIQGWAAQLPDGADEARGLALRCVAEKESKIEKYKGRLEEEAVRLKRRTEGSDRPKW